MKKLTQLSILIAIFLTACSRPSAQNPAPAVAHDAAPVNVATILAQEQPMPRYQRVTGELSGARQAMLAPDASGKVVAAPIERGSVVKAGYVILKLDDRAATLALRESEASLADAQLKLDWARSEFARNGTLAKTKLISSADFEHFKINHSTAEAMLAAAVARRDSSKTALDDTVLRAPFAGTVVERLTEVSEFVSSTTGVARLVATENLRLVVNVPETAVGGICEGQRVEFTVPAFPGESFTGKVKFIGAARRESARDLALEAAAGNADGRLKPGMFAEGRIAIAEEKSLTIPLAAVRVDGSTRKVFVSTKMRSRSASWKSARRRAARGEARRRCRTPQGGGCRGEHVGSSASWNQRVSMPHFIDFDANRTAEARGA